MPLLNDAQWSPESPAFNHPASAPYIQELTTICQQLVQRLQRPVRLPEVGIRTDRAAESLLVQLNTGQIEYVGLEQSREILLSVRQRLAPQPGARLSFWNTDTLAAHVRSTDIIWLNNVLHRLLPEDPGFLATLQQLAVPGALSYVMEFRRLTPSVLLSTFLLTNGQSGTLLHNSADWAALFSTAAFNCQHGDEVAELQRFPVQRSDKQVRRDPCQLQAVLAGRLSGRTVPQRIAFLDALPLVTNGKIDCQALEHRHATEAENPAEVDLPQSDTEKQAAALQ